MNHTRLATFASAALLSILSTTCARPAPQTAKATYDAARGVVAIATRRQSEEARVRDQIEQRLEVARPLRLLEALDERHVAPFAVPTALVPSMNVPIEVAIGSDSSS